MKKIVLPLALCAAFAAFADIPGVTPVPRDADWLKAHEKNVVLAKAGGAPVVFLGGDITWHWTYPDNGKPVWDRYARLGAPKAVNFGIRGDRTEHLLWRVENGELDGFEAKLVVLEAGLDNIRQRTFEEEPPADTMIAVKTLVNAICRRQPKAKVLVHPVFPTAVDGRETAADLQKRIDTVNFELWKFCDGFNVIWCDFLDKLTTADGRYPAGVSKDGLKPLTIGYEIWAAEVLPYARAAAAGTDLPPSRFPARLTPSTAGFGRASVTVTPQTGLECRYDMWYGRLRQHRRMIAENASKKYDLVFCGDSITHLWEGYGKEVYPDITNRYSVLNLGYCGDSIQHLLWRLRNGEGQGYTAKLFMVMIGTNNPSDPAKLVTDGIVNVVKAIHEIHPEAKVLLLPIFPRGEKAGNGYRTKNAEASEAARKALADDKDVIWLDFNDRFLQPDGTLPKAMFSDELHPNADGYRIWCDAVMPCFEKYAGRK